MGNLPEIKNLVSCILYLVSCMYIYVLEIFKIRYYMYYAVFNSLCKLLLYLSHKCYV